MVFSSILFLFRFMPIAFIVYYLTPRRYKNLVLFIESIIFYSWGEVKYFPIMVASVLVDYIASTGIRLHRQNKAACKGFLLMSVFLIWECCSSSNIPISLFKISTPWRALPSRCSI